MSVQPPPPQGSYTPPAGYAPPPYQPGPAPGVRYSGRAARLVAYFIDGFVISAILFVFCAVGGILLAMGAGGDSAILALIGGVVVFIGILVALAYKPLGWSRSGQTIGYKLMRLRVVRAVDGGSVSGGQAIGRLFGYIVSGFLFSLGFIWIAFDEKRQGWHDKLAGTVVIEV